MHAGGEDKSCIQEGEDSLKYRHFDKIKNVIKILFKLKDIKYNTLG